MKIKKQKPSWDTAPDWANALAYVITEEFPEFYGYVFGEDVSKRMNEKWCWFSDTIPLNRRLHGFELRPEDDSEKMYLVWIFFYIGIAVNPGKYKVGIGYYVKSTLNKNKIKTYHELLSPTISDVFVYTLPEYIAMGNKVPEYSWHREIKGENYDESIKKLVKAYKKYEKEYSQLLSRIANPNFEKNAPPKIVNKCREDFNNASRNIELVKNKLIKIGVMTE